MGVWPVVKGAKPARLEARKSEVEGLRTRAGLRMHWGGRAGAGSAGTEAGGVKGSGIPASDPCPLSFSSFLWLARPRLTPAGLFLPWHRRSPVSSMSEAGVVLRGWMETLSS